MRYIIPTKPLFSLAVIALVTLFSTSNSSAQCTAVPTVPNDPCYQQVIAADPYCCNTLWDGVCQTAYDACSPPPAGGPCNSITPIACGASATANLNGTGAWNTAPCGFGTPGQEAIYSITATTTGLYTIDVTAISGGYVDFAWMDAAGGCSSTGWTCIDDVIFTGTYGAMNWTAGNTYYILLDPEGTGAYSATFDVNCPAAGVDPCTSITPVACGASATANLNGTGVWNTSNCGFSTPGQEAIYSITATTTGVYTIDVTAISGGYIDFAWMDAAGGCSSAGWTCIGDVIFTGNYGAMNWTAGNTYYILLDPEGTGAYSATFDVNCPTGGAGPCASITPLIGCGTGTGASMSGTGSWGTSACGYSTPGVELIFSFTATASGIHSIDIPSTSGSFVDFQWINSTAGCSSTGWNCIDDVWTPGNYGAMNWTAGETYYILLDPETTLATSLTFDINCPNPGGPVVASDCISNVPVCTDLDFAINPNGFGLVDELCTYCTSNPGINPSSANSGCLNSGELNSSWFTVNVASGGLLEFSFGAEGPINCYDWIMWEYTPTSCTDIPANNQAPITCNWNLPCESFTGIANTLPTGGEPGNFEPGLTVSTGDQFLICFSNYSSALTTVPLNFFGSADISCTPLPVEAIEFYGENAPGYNVLSWSTLTEMNSSHYDVEQSLDGINFTKIGSVEAAGMSLEPSHYRFNDYSPNTSGVTYYRLKQVDINNAFKYTEAIALNLESSTTDFSIVSAFPNPAKDQFTIQLLLAQKDNVTIQITDLNGRVMDQFENDCSKGVNALEVPVDAYTSGMYLITLVNTRTNQLEKIKLSIQ
ncbi:MAG: T9SS type A sorting domain-containing protein [Crocinitomicaceae bacterium]|nr:T9SS type A sorting domain-containing protein [Crocinitomicaceae bacterium]